MSILSKRERKLIENAAIVFPGRHIRVSLRSQIADKKSLKEPSDDVEKENEDDDLMNIRQRTMRSRTILDRVSSYIISLHETIEIHINDPN